MASCCSEVHVIIVHKPTSAAVKRRVPTGCARRFEEEEGTSTGSCGVVEDNRVCVRSV